MTPPLSVVIPACDAARWLAAAVASVRRESPDCEIVVVDDGSRDGTRAVAATLGVTLVAQPNAGPPAARNTGLRHACGAWIAFLDADDEWAPGRLAPLAAALASADVAWGTVQLCRDAPGGLQDVPGVPPNVVFQVGSGLFRRDVFDRVGTFDEALRAAEDLDWILRAREAGARFAMVPQVVTRRRVHDASLSAGRTPQELNLLRVLGRSLQRRRAKGVHGDLPALGKAARTGGDDPAT